MTVDTTQVLDAAMQLPHHARAFLAERLLESLDAEPGTPLSAKWRQEIARRCEEIDSGDVELVPAERAFGEALEALG